MGHVGSTTRSPGQILEKPCVHCFLFSTLLKLLRMFVLVISWMSLKIGHVGSKSRSLGQILEKPCVRCRGHIFSPILLKFSKNVGIQHFFLFFTMFSTPLRDQSHSLIHILFVLCRRFRLMSLKFYCLVIHISHKTLEIGCAWSKGSGERLQGHHGPLVIYLKGTRK